MEAYVWKTLNKSLILTTTLRGRCYYPHFIHKEAEAQRLSNLPKIIQLSGQVGAHTLVILESLPLPLHAIPSGSYQTLVGLQKQRECGHYME